MSKPISNSEMVKVEAAKLRLHPLAVRRLLPTKLKRLIETLDLDAIGVLHAVRYKIGTETAIWIIDGQHRLAALLEHGFGEWLVEVKIHTDVDNDERACALFLKLNDRSPISPYDKFLNEIQANIPAAVGALEVIKRHSLRVSRNNEDGALACVTAVKKIYILDGGRTLYTVLRVATGAWGHKTEAVEGKVLLGLAVALCGKNGLMDIPSLTMKLAKYPGGAPGLLGDARGIRKYKHNSNLAACVAERVIDLYNIRKTKGAVAKDQATK